jgi:anti-sigma factor RsiW
VKLSLDAKDDGHDVDLTMRISQRDLEAISAYLDGQLSQRERARLEARLKTDPGLREAYEQIHHTRAILRSLPAVRAPRNFTLTPQMVRAKRSPAPAYPVLRLASVVATLLFVLVMVGDLVTPRSVALAPVMEAPAEEGATLMQAPEETEAGFLEAAPAAEPLAESQRTTVEDQAAGETESPPGMMELAAPTPVPTESILLAPPAAGLEPAVEGEVPEADSQEEEATKAPAPTYNYWRILQVMFALVALATGIAAAFLRRSNPG